MFTVENNIPVPEKNNYRSKIKRFMMELRVGQSFVIPKDMDQKKISTLIYYHARSLGMRFTARINEGEYRFWRIK